MILPPSSLPYLPPHYTLPRSLSLIPGYMISCMAKNYQTALVLSTPLTFPLLLFGGFYMQPGWVPCSWCDYNGAKTMQTEPFIL